MNLRALGSIFLLLAAVQAQQPTVIVRPVETADVLVNPGMGIETFQRFNGDVLNGMTWSEAGPTAPIAPSRQNPNFPGSSIAYCRWFWQTLEPLPGQIRWEILDLALAQARLHHQALAIRLMPYDESHPLPDWYRNSGARRANRATDPDGNVWQPDFSDPLYLKYWGRLITEAGARYDGNPFLDSVDISTIGYWGEGWSPYMPAFSYQKALIDVYLKAFTRTPLLMNFDEQQALTYATTQGSGWRLDCWGDMRTQSDRPFFPPEMLDIYPQQVVRAGIEDAWRRSPVSLESCWVPMYWKQQGWDVNYILEQALRWHVTSVNIKSSPVPPEWRAQFDDFQRRMGYRFVLRRLEYPRDVRPGTMMPVHMWWFNAGVARVYREYWLTMNLASPGQASYSMRVPVDVRKWLPGDAVYDGSLWVPNDVTRGTYDVRIGLLDPRTGLPAIRLAIGGRTPDGWYDVGTINVR